MGNWMTGLPQRPGATNAKKSSWLPSRIELQTLCTETYVSTHSTIADKIIHHTALYKIKIQKNFKHCASSPPNLIQLNLGHFAPVLGLKKTFSQLL